MNRYGRSPALVLGFLMLGWGHNQVVEAQEGPVRQPILAPPVAASRAVNYEEREKLATPAIKSQLAQLRQLIQANRLRFQVGYTTALDFAIPQITGLVPPPNLDAQIRRQNVLAEKLLAVDRAARTEYDRLSPGRLPELRLRCAAAARVWDWRSLGKVTPVRNQGGCGSCWAFGTLGAYESSYLIRNNLERDTSEQHLVNCSGVGTCSGGWWAFDYLIATGTASESVVPYLATNGTCNTSNATPFRAVAWGYVTNSSSVPTVTQLKAALCQYGPLAVAVRVNPAFQAYTGGVFNANAAGSVNHGVTLIGWDDNRGAWLIKNSWGTGWGETGGRGTERGYMWIAYGTSSIGYAAAWVQARNNFYILPRQYYELMPNIKPFPDPEPLIPIRPELRPDTRQPQRVPRTPAGTPRPPR